MLLRERTREPRQRAASGPSCGGNLEAMRAEAEALTRTADEAIDRALSGDSLAYNQSTQQTGGQ